MVARSAWKSCCSACAATPMVGKVPLSAAAVVFVAVVAAFAFALALAVAFAFAPVAALSAADCDVACGAVCASAGVANGMAKASANAVASGVWLNMEIPSDVRLPSSHGFHGIDDKNAIGWLPFALVEQAMTGWLAGFK
jgi:hypothetical protein